MREIKFRYVLSNDKNIIAKTFTLDEIQNDIEWIYEQFEIEFGGECTCLNESCSHCECDALFDDYKIISRDQFTGLHDKNGKEIYEGDIAETCDGIFFVIWEFTGWLCFNNDTYYDLAKYVGKLSCEIIGNIHENAELLK